jgi:hypothetical protein
MQNTLFGIVKFQTLQAEALGIISSNFQISPTQCSMHCKLDDRGDILGFTANQNVRLSEVIFTDTLDSDHLQTIFRFWTLLEQGKF